MRHYLFGIEERSLVTISVGNTVNRLASLGLTWWVQGCDSKRASVIDTERRSVLTGSPGVPVVRDPHSEEPNNATHATYDTTSTADQYLVYQNKSRNRYNSFRCSWLIFKIGTNSARRKHVFGVMVNYRFTTS